MHYISPYYYIKQKLCCVTLTVCTYDTKWYFMYLKVNNQKLRLF